MYRIGWKDRYARDICFDILGYTLDDMNAFGYDMTYTRKQFKEWLKREYRATIDNTLGGSFITFESEEDMALFLVRWS